ncbi:MAG: MFS transporter [Gemmatimonadota bacterium]
MAMTLPPMSGDHRPKLGRNITVLAAASFFTDVASEMIYPLLPVFLSTVLGTSVAALGVIEGMAERVSSLLRIPAGWWSDKTRRRKQFVVIGYAIAAVARPLIGLAQGAGQVLAIRLTDRFGKGVRTAPRDALIAESVAPSQRGYAYGFHRAADSAGAVVGPLIAWAVLSAGWVELRTLFLFAVIPGAISVALVGLFVRERVAEPVAEVVATEAPPRRQPAPLISLGTPFWRFLVAIFLFTLGASTDAFLLLRASQLGVPTAVLPILWAALHLVKTSSTVIGGALSDRYGRRPLILGGWMVYAATYLGFALASTAWQAWALFLVYGLYFGLTEGSERAMIADLVPAASRGTAFGWFNAAVGLGALPASALFGVVWQGYGPPAAFVMGASFAVVAALYLVLAVPVISSSATPDARSAR